MSKKNERVIEVNQRAISSFLEETPSVLENKFDTPGPGTYDVSGQFDSNGRLIPSSINRFKKQNSKSPQDKFLSAETASKGGVSFGIGGGTTDRSILSNTLNLS